MRNSNFFAGVFIILISGVFSLLISIFITAGANEKVSPVPVEPLRFVICYSDMSVCRDLKEVQEEPPVYDHSTGKWW